MSRRRQRLREAATLAALLALAGCSAIEADWTRAEAARIAAAAGFQAAPVEAGRFTLASYRRIGAGDKLVVYIEGDGLAFISRTQVSANPTPSDPIALRLATEDDAPSVLYLARPCQFVTGPEARNCEPQYWTSARYAESVIDGFSHAIDGVERATGKRHLELIGYSGGGVVATLLAARRGDVDRVITVAANLDLAAWTNYHRITPLASLNPADFADRLSHVPQVMFVGARDEVVPLAVTQSYRAALAAGAPVVIRPVADYSHGCCWEKTWPELLREARAE
jgi:pimeloyl-ACP methyl ester carboxylesterase